MRRILIALVALTLIVGIGYALRFDYVTANGQALRVNRYTGQTEALRAGEGWRPIKTRPVPRQLTAQEQKEMAALTAEANARLERMNATPDPRCPNGGRYVSTPNGPWCQL